MSKILTLDELKDLGQMALKNARDQLKEFGTVNPLQILIGRNQELYPVIFPPELFNSGAGKDILFNAIRRVARSKDAQAYISVTDGWTIKRSMAELKREREDEDYRARFHAMMNAPHSVQDVVDAGFGKLAEVIMVSVQTPVYELMINQLYTRNNEKRTIRFGKCVMHDTTQGAHTGRMMIWGDQE